MAVYDPNNPYAFDPYGPDTPGIQDPNKMVQDILAQVNKPENAPPNSVWNAGTNTWDVTAPGSPGYDPTYGGYVDPDDPTDPNSTWLDEVYENQGWGPRPDPTPY